MSQKITEGEYLDALKTVREYLVQVRNESNEIDQAVKIESNDKMKLRIVELPLSVRATNVLHSGNIYTVADLVKENQFKLYRFRNMGKKTVQEILEWMNKNDVEFLSFSD